MFNNSLHTIFIWRGVVILSSRYIFEKLEEVVNQPNIKNCMIEVRMDGKERVHISTEQGWDWWSFDEIEALYKFVQIQKCNEIQILC